MDAIKHQGKVADTTLFPEETKLHSGDIVGKSEGLNRTQVYRYIRLTELAPRLIDMVDEKRLSLNMGVELSYFNRNVQQWLYEYIKENGMLKQEQIMDLRQYREDNNLTQEQLIEILVKSRATTEKRKKITITERKLNKYFPSYYSQSEIERIIVGLLEQWKVDQEA